MFKETLKCISLISSGILISHITTNYILSLFNNKKQTKKVKKSPFIIIVGVGGVGSHTVMSLLRSGITHIRIIDYDAVSLSSLNRHAFSFRKDVGKLKVNLISEYSKKMNKDIIIESIDDAMLPEYTDKYILKGKPDFVIDCIDDLDSKIELIHYCVKHNIKIISSMGAAGMCDASSIRYCDFDMIKGDKMAKRLRYQYKKKYKDEEIPKIPCVYSIEKNFRGLSELEEYQKENIEQHRINFNERVRTLPVFACLPAAFGQCIAGRVIGEINGRKFENTIANASEGGEMKMIPLIGNKSLDKVIEDYKSDEVKRGVNEKDINFVYEDYLKVAQAFKFVSSVSQVPGSKMKFSRFRTYKDISIHNLVILSKTELNKIYQVKNENDLINAFGKENIERIDNILNKIK